MLKLDSQFEPLTRDDVVARVSNITDGQVAAILGLGATKQEFAAALAWADLEDDAMQDEQQPLSGLTATIYEILTEGEVSEEDSRR